jgi:hypothetical protein
MPLTHRRLVVALLGVFVMGAFVAAYSRAAERKSSPNAGRVWSDLMEGNKRFIMGKPLEREFVQNQNDRAWMWRRRCARTRSNGEILRSAQNDRGFC